MTNVKTILQLSPAAYVRALINHEGDLTMNDFAMASAKAADAIERSFRLDQDFMRELSIQGLSPVWTKNRFCVAEFDVAIPVFMRHHGLNALAPNLAKYAVANPTEKFTVGIVYTVQASGESAWILYRQWPQAIETGSSEHDEVNLVLSRANLTHVFDYLQAMHVELRAKVGQAMLIERLVERNCYFTEQGFDAQPPKDAPRQRLGDCIVT